jgi:hypothetical protein
MCTLFALTSTQWTEPDIEPQVTALNSDPFLVLPENEELGENEDLDPSGETIHQNSLYGNPLDLVITKYLPGQERQDRSGYQKSRKCPEEEMNSLRDNFNYFTLNCTQRQLLFLMPLAPIREEDDSPGLHRTKRKVQKNKILRL